MLDKDRQHRSVCDKTRSLTAPAKKIPGGASSWASDDLVIRVNKRGAQVFRVVLEDARKQVRERELLNFSSASPDLVFKNRSNRRGDRQCGGVASDR